MTNIFRLALTLMGTGCTLAGPFTFIALNDPTATSGTYAEGINNSGQIVGYINTASDSYGFSYDGSAYTALVDPNAISGSGGTRAFGVNDAGQIVGAYYAAGEYGFFFNGSS
jgi:probable HAF family extracellular repeat protein